MLTPSEIESSKTEPKCSATATSVACAPTLSMRNPRAKVTVVFQMSRNDGGLDQGFTVATPQSIQEFEEIGCRLEEIACGDESELRLASNRVRC